MFWVIVMKFSMGIKLENISCVGEVVFVGISFILCNFVVVSGIFFLVFCWLLLIGYKKMWVFVGFESFKG